MRILAVGDIVGRAGLQKLKDVLPKIVSEKDIIIMDIILHDGFKSGKVKEKYPLYWLSEKQMMITKYNKWKELRRIEGFDLGQEKMKQYEYEDDVYKVVIPLKSSDILDEAQQQQHCVASYVNRIARGETNIVFIRQRLNEEET